MSGGLRKMCWVFVVFFLKIGRVARLLKEFLGKVMRDSNYLHSMYLLE